MRKFLMFSMFMVLGFFALDGAPTLDAAREPAGPIVSIVPIISVYPMPMFGAGKEGDIIDYRYLCDCASPPPWCNGWWRREMHDYAPGGQAPLMYFRPKDLPVGNPGGDGKLSRD
jgi:hypothetical protein